MNVIGCTVCGEAWAQPIRECYRIDCPNSGIVGADIEVKRAAPPASPEPIPEWKQRLLDRCDAAIADIASGPEHYQRSAADAATREGAEKENGKAKEMDRPQVQRATSAPAAPAPVGQAEPAADAELIAWLNAYADAAEHDGAPAPQLRKAANRIAELIQAPFIEALARALGNSAYWQDRAMKAEAAAAELAQELAAACERRDTFEAVSIARGNLLFKANDECDRLKAAAAEWESAFCDMRNAREQYRIAAATSAEDAARYRWLRPRISPSARALFNGKELWELMLTPAPGVGDARMDVLDADIDAARAQEPRE